MLVSPSEAQVSFPATSGPEIKNHSSHGPNSIHVPSHLFVQFLQCWVILKHQTMTKIQKLSSLKSHIPFQKNLQRKTEFPEQLFTYKIQGFWDVNPCFWASYSHTIVVPSSSGSWPQWWRHYHPLKWQESLTQWYSIIPAHFHLQQQHPPPIFQLFTQAAILHFLETTCQAGLEMKHG